MAIVLLLVLLVLCYFILGAFGITVFSPSTQDLSIVVLTSGEDPIPGATVTFSWGAEPAVVRTTSASGIATVNVPVGQAVSFSVEKEDYQKLTDQVIASELHKETRVKLQKALSTISREVQLKTADSKELVSGPINVRFRCSSTDYTKDVTSVDGLLKLADIPENCGKLTATLLSPGKLTGDSLDITEPAPELFFMADEVAYGTIRISFTDKAGRALPSRSPTRPAEPCRALARGSFACRAELRAPRFSMPRPRFPA
jgi:hypothetical protein